MSHTQDVLPGFGGMTSHITLTTSLVREMEEEEVRECQALTFGDSGFMAEEYARASCYKTGAISIQAWDGAYLVGHALLFREGSSECTDDPPSGWTAYFYVEEGRRLEGIGRMLRIRVNEIDPDHEVCPHDYVSRRFFEDTKESLEESLFAGV